MSASTYFLNLFFVQRHVDSLKPEYTQSISDLFTFTVAGPRRTDQICLLSPLQGLVVPINNPDSCLVLNLANFTEAIDSERSQALLTRCFAHAQQRFGLSRVLRADMSLGGGQNVGVGVPSGESGGVARDVMSGTQDKNVVGGVLAKEIGLWIDDGLEPKSFGLESKVRYSCLLSLLAASAWGYGEAQLLHAEDAARTVQLQQESQQGDGPEARNPFGNWPVEVLRGSVGRALQCITHDFARDLEIDLRGMDSRVVTLGEALWELAGIDSDSFGVPGSDEDGAEEWIRLLLGMMAELRAGARWDSAEVRLLAAMSADVAKSGSESNSGGAGMRMGESKLVMHCRSEFDVQSKLMDLAGMSQSEMTRGEGNLRMHHSTHTRAHRNVVSTNRSEMTGAERMLCLLRHTSYPTACACVLNLQH